MAIRRIVIFLLVAASLTGCATGQTETVSTSPPIGYQPTQTSPATSPLPGTTIPQPSVTPLRNSYEFPASIDSARRYLFYLHGKIIEEQGLPAISPAYGAYEYDAILKKLASFGFVVISEIRTKDTDPTEFAQRAVGQINRLLAANVPPEHITVVGASKGAGIAATISNLLKNDKMNFVLLGYCSPDEIAALKANKLPLSGNILAIYDSVDESAGSCQELFTFSEGKGIGRHEQIVLHIGTGHGILFKPLDDWIIATVGWAQK